MVNGKFVCRVFKFLFSSCIFSDEEDPLKSEGESDAVVDEDDVGNRQSNAFDGFGSEVVLLDGKSNTEFTYLLPSITLLHRILDYVCTCLSPCVAYISRRGRDG